MFDGNLEKLYFGVSSLDYLVILKILSWEYPAWGNFFEVPLHLFFRRHILHHIADHLTR